MLKLTLAREDLKGHRFDGEELIETDDKIEFFDDRINNAVKLLVTELLQEQLNKSCDSDES